MNTKLHAICDSRGRPLNLFVTAGQVSDYIGARALLSSLPNVDWLLGDRGYDADWFREALKDKGIRACIPGRKQRKKPAKYDKRRYKRRNRPSAADTLRPKLLDQVRPVTEVQNLVLTSGEVRRVCCGDQLKRQKSGRSAMRNLEGQRHSVISGTALHRMTKLSGTQYRRKTRRTYQGTKAIKATPRANTEAARTIQFSAIAL